MQPEQSIGPASLGNSEGSVKNDVLTETRRRLGIGPDDSVIAHTLTLYQQAGVLDAGEHAIAEFMTNVIRPTETDWTPEEISEQARLHRSKHEDSARIRGIDQFLSGK